ncbi:MAG: zinc ribbon domain-containing protein [Promethearchaeota archaeon]
MSEPNPFEKFSKVIWKYAIILVLSAFFIVPGIFLILINYKLIEIARRIYNKYYFDEFKNFARYKFISFVLAIIFTVPLIVFSLVDYIVVSSLTAEDDMALLSVFALIRYSLLFSSMMVFIICFTLEFISWRGLKKFFNLNASGYAKDQGVKASNNVIISQTLSMFCASMIAVVSSFNCSIALNPVPQNKLVLETSLVSFLPEFGAIILVPALLSLALSVSGMRKTSIYMKEAVNPRRRALDQRLSRYLTPGSNSLPFSPGNPTYGMLMRYVDPASPNFNNCMLASNPTTVNGLRLDSDGYSRLINNDNNDIIDARVEHGTGRDLNSSESGEKDYLDVEPISPKKYLALLEKKDDTIHEPESIPNETGLDPARHSQQQTNYHPGVRVRRYCPFCGFRIPDVILDTKFCPSCGTFRNIGTVHRRRGKNE